jgi:FdhD protein
VIPVLPAVDAEAGLRPLLSNEGRPATSVVAAVNERGEEVPTPVAGEHPLTIYLDKRELVTLMTLGGAPEYLTLGYLRNQRLIDDITAIARVQVDWEVEAVAVTSRRLADTGVTIWDEEGDDPIAERLAHRTVTTGCGQGTVFGDLMADVDAIRLDPDMRFSEASLYAIMDLVRRHESIYKQAGAVHGCALCVQEGRGARILQFVEDVGRHNAVDAIAGWMWNHGVPGRDKIFYTTGRLTSEMVIKCAQMDIPVLLSRSGLTEMGHRIAEQVGITMIGRCQGKHYLLFTGRERFFGAGAGSATPPVSAEGSGRREAP